MQAGILSKYEENLWDNFIKDHPQATIHQTSGWGHFQEKIPARGKYWIIVVENPLERASPPSQTSISAGTLLIRHSLPKGYCWLYAPRGPLLDYQNSQNAQEQMKHLLPEIKKIAKEERAVFLRIDPPLDVVSFVRTDKSESQFPGFHKTKHGFQPQHTLMVDLTQTEEQILAQMKQKGRYNIRLAEKKGVQITQVDPKNAIRFKKDLQDFYEILTQTTARDGFHGHDLQYYENMLDSLKPDDLTSHPHAKLYLAKHNGQPLAAAIVTYFNDTATYYYGASSNQHRELMAPYLLHWQIMKDARAQNCKFYDFFGIAPENAKKHPWQSVTEFKKKFGGHILNYQPAQEYGFKKLLHAAYKIYKKNRS